VAANGTLFDVCSDYQKLCIARDYAAYRAVGAIDAAICSCRRGDAETALQILTNARAEYERADTRLQNHKSQKSKKEN
jgi:glutamine amidotransferase-like uncharacterized protein